MPHVLLPSLLKPGFFKGLLHLFCSLRLKYLPFLPAPPLDLCFSNLP